MLWPALHLRVLGPGHRCLFLEERRPFSDVSFLVEEPLPLRACRRGDAHEQQAEALCPTVLSLSGGCCAFMISDGETWLGSALPFRWKL